MDWIDLAQDRDQWWVLVNTVMNLRGSVKHWEIHEYQIGCGFPKMTQLRRASLHPCFQVGQRHRNTEGEMNYCLWEQRRQRAQSPQSLR
jgi:hypothetical protein